MIHKLIASNKVMSMMLFPLILLLFQIPFFIQKPSILGLNISIFNEFFQYLFENFLPFLKISRFLIIILGAFVLQRLVAKLELQRDRGHHALYWYGFLNTFFLGAELDLSIPIANLFLILSLARTLSIYRDTKAYSVSFDSGLYLGCAILFNPFYILLIGFTWISLTTLKTLKYREVILVIVGLITPVLLVSFCIYFFDLGFPAFFKQLSWRPAEMFGLVKNNVNNVNTLSIIGNVLTIIIVVYGILKLIQIANSENTRRSKIFQLLFILTVFMAIIQLLSRLNGMNVPSVIILSVPVSTMMIHYFSTKKYEWIPLSGFYIWFIVAMVNSILVIF